MWNGQHPDPASAASPAATFGGAVAELAPYLMVEPFVADRDVLDLEPAHASGADRLGVAGRARVRSATWDGERIDAPDASFDVVLCLRRFALAAARERDVMLAEMRRVLRPDGFAVVRVVSESCKLPAAQWERVSPGELVRLLRGWFVDVDVVAQVPFYGFSFGVPGVPEVAVNEDLLPDAPEPMFHLAFCPNGATRPYMLAESLLVPVLAADGAAPVSGDELAALSARVELLTRERDALRERMMTMEDQRERLERATAALRRDAERLLQQVTEQAEALELLGLERDRAERRAQAAERGQTSVNGHAAYDAPERERSPG